MFTSTSGSKPTAFRKALVSLALAALALTSSIGVAAPASADLLETFSYSVDNDGNLTILDCDGACPTSFEIPSTYLGYPVTAIGDNAFNGQSITSVLLPDSLLSIGNFAFANNPMTSITLPSALTSLGDSAFQYTELTSVSLPSSLTTVGNYSFWGNKLTSLTLTSSVTTIGNLAFGNNLLSTVTIPSSVTSIGSGAFYYNLLTSVVFEGNAPSDGGGVFGSNDSLGSVTVPFTATGWGSTFSDVTVTRGDAPFTYTTDGDNNVTITGYSGTLAADLVIPATLGGKRVIGISSGAFLDRSLTSLSLPASLTSMGSAAFQNNNLSTVIFSGNAPSDGGGVFADNPNLSVIDVSYGTSSWGASFSGLAVRVGKYGPFTYQADIYGSLTVTGYIGTAPADLVIPESLGGNPVKIIDGDAFASKQLTSVTIPSSVYMIRGRAFANNLLTSVTLPASIISLGLRAFAGNQLTSVSFAGNAPVGSEPEIFLGNSNLAAIDVAYQSTGWASTYDGLPVRYAYAPLLYTTNGDGEVTVTGCGGGECDPDLLIPATLGGNPVKSVGAYAFSTAQLKSVSIPSTVTTIGAHAFQHNSLQALSLPSSLTSLGEYAFASNGLNSVILPSSLTSVSQGAFSNNHLTSVSIPNTVTSIAADAFIGNNLTSVTVPNSVQNIDAYAFAENSLTSVIFEGNAPTIGSNIFFDNSDLAAVDVVLGSTGWGSDFAGISVRVGKYGPFTYTTDVDNRLTITGYAGTLPADLVIPETLGDNPVTGLADSAFAFANLTSVSLPSSLVEIGTHCFLNNALTTVAIPASVTTIGFGSFRNNSLTSVTIPNSVTAIDGFAFANNKLSSVTLSSSLSTIGPWAFWDNELESVTIPASVTQISQAAFTNNSLTSVSFQGDAPTDGTGIFGENPSLSLVDVAYGSTGWGAAFSGVTVRVGDAPLTYSTDADNNVTVTGCIGTCPVDLVIPATLGGNPVTSIGDNAFKGMGLTSVTFPDSLTTVGYWAFENNALTSVTLPTSLTTLRAGAFYINSLASVEVPSSVTTVEDYVFAKNAPLATVTFKGDAPAEGNNVFENDPDLTAVDVAYGSTGWGATFSGVTVRVGDAPFTYTTDESNNVTITGYAGTVPTDLVIPATLGGKPVTAIGEWAFVGRSLTSLTLPDTLLSIGDLAFFSNSLTALTLPSSVTNIGIEAFGSNDITALSIPASVTSISDWAFDSNSIADLVLPSTLTSIGKGAFRGNLLTTLTIPASVTSIGEVAFSENELLASVTFAGNAPTAGTDVFADDYALESVRVSYGTTGWESIFSDKPVVVVGAPLGKPASAPSIRTVKAGNGQVSLGFWAPRKNGGSDITGYEYTVDDGVTWTAVDPAGIGAKSLVIAELTNGTRYTIKVRAVNAAGGGAASNAKAFTPRTVANAPTNVVLSVSSGRIKVEFEAPTNNGGATITRYGYSINGRPVQNFGSTSTTQWIKNLKNGSTYTVRVMALNAAGWGAISDTVEATPRK